MFGSTSAASPIFGTSPEGSTISSLRSHVCYFSIPLGVFRLGIANRKHRFANDLLNQYSGQMRQSLGSMSKVTVRNPPSLPARLLPAPLLSSSTGGQSFSLPSVGAASKQVKQHRAHPMISIVSAHCRYLT